MPRKKLIRTSIHYYHVTSRSNNKEWFYIPTHNVWEICVRLLNIGKKKFSIEIYSFVLMSNHYHLLIKTPLANIDKFMQFFNKNLGQLISREANRINRIFGAPYKWNIIENPNYFKNVYRYIYQNPLRANLVIKCEDYPYSTLAQKKGFLKSKNSIINLSFCGDMELSSSDWLNDMYDEHKLRLINKALRKTVYIEKMDRKAKVSMKN